MRTVSFLFLALTTAFGAQASATPKRGLVYIPSSAHPTDDNIFLGSKNSMTWYYSYQSTPSPAVTGTPAGLEFVPMLWGDYANTFVNDVRSAGGVKYVLGFNEPDMIQDWGGSQITPQRAAEAWKESIQPLAAYGVKLGAPAVSGATSGRDWLTAFMSACTGCTIDFIPLHWYGDFQGLASQLGWANQAFPGKKLWVTELGFANVDLATTESFFNTTVAYLDGLSYVERYSWFGAFRSDVSNVGPNGAMLDASGKLTDIGLWYLGKTS